MGELVAQAFDVRYKFLIHPLDKWFLSNSLGFLTERVRLHSFGSLALESLTAAVASSFQSRLPRLPILD